MIGASWVCHYRFAGFYQAEQDLFEAARFRLPLEVRKDACSRLCVLRIGRSLSPCFGAWELTPARETALHLNLNASLAISPTVLIGLPLDQERDRSVAGNDRTQGVAHGLTSAVRATCEGPLSKGSCGSQAIPAQDGPLCQNVIAGLNRTVRHLATNIHAYWIL
jgi:hypothetical protein